MKNVLELLSVQTAISSPSAFAPPVLTLFHVVAGLWTPSSHNYVRILSHCSFKPNSFSLFLFFCCAPHLLPAHIARSLSSLSLHHHFKIMQITCYLFWKQLESLTLFSDQSFFAHTKNCRFFKYHRLMKFLNYLTSELFYVGSFMFLCRMWVNFQLFKMLDGWI